MVAIHLHKYMTHADTHDCGSYLLCLEPHLEEEKESSLYSHEYSTVTL